MILSEGIINKELFAHPNDHPEQVLEMMEGFELTGISVVENRKFQGVLTKETLLNALDENFNISGLLLKPVYMMENVHILDAVLFFKIHKINFIPILDVSQQYLGFMDAVSLLEQLDKILVTADPGLIIVMEMAYLDYSLAKVCHILESNQAKVLSSFTRELVEREHVELTLKISRDHSSRAVQALQRHEFKIKDIYHAIEPDHLDDLTARYQQLMNYINM